MQTTTQYSAVLERLVKERLIREPERRSITGVSRAQWHRYELAGRAPRRIHSSERTRCWRLTDLERWVELTARGEKWSEPAKKV